MKKIIMSKDGFMDQHFFGNKKLLGTMKEANIA